MKEPTRRPMVGLAGGLLGGLAGALATNCFHELRRRLAPGRQPGERQSYVGRTGRASGRGEQLSQGVPGQETNAAVVLADRIAPRVLGRALRDPEREAAGALLHYGFSAVTGAAYGAAVERMPRATTGRGLLFGVVVWALADEGAIPAMRLTRPRRELPAAAHLASLAGHLVYGLTVEATRRAVMALARAQRIVQSRNSSSAMVPISSRLPRTAATLAPESRPPSSR